MIAMPDPASIQLIPWREEETNRTARMFCDIQVPGGDPYEGDPRWIMRRAIDRARDMGFDDYNIGPELEYFYFRSAKPESGDARGARRGRLLRSDHAGCRLRRAPGDHAGARAARYPRRVRPPRGRTLPARGRHALQGRARDVRRLHDLPDHGQGVRDEVRLARDLHAEAAAGRERLRDARPPVALEGGQERLLRSGRPVLPLRRRQGVHRRPAQARPGDCAAVRPVGQLLQAARARLRGPGLPLLVASQPLGAYPGAALPPGQGERHPRRAALS